MKRVKIFIGTKEETTLWDHDAVDEFYKDDISWLDDDALTASDKQLQYYEVSCLSVTFEFISHNTHESHGFNY